MSDKLRYKEIEAQKAADAKKKAEDDAKAAIEAAIKLEKELKEAEEVAYRESLKVARKYIIDTAVTDPISTVVDKTQSGTVAFYHEFLKNHLYTSFEKALEEYKTAKASGDSVAIAAATEALVEAISSVYDTAGQVVNIAKVTATKYENAVAGYKLIVEENAYTEKFVDLMFEKNGEDYKIILSGLETISLEILINLMSKIRNKINDNYVNVDLGYFCIRILDKLYQNKDNLTDDEKHLVTVLIEIIRKLKYKPQQFIIDLLNVLYMWLPVFINTQDYIGENERILDSLINRNDFEKYSLIVDCHIELKEKYNIVISEIQKRELIKAIDLESDKTLIYSLCFNYQNMKYISNNSVKALSASDFTFSCVDKEDGETCEGIPNDAYYVLEKITISDTSITKITIPSTYTDSYGTWDVEAIATDAIVSTGPLTLTKLSLPTKDIVLSNIKPP